MIGTKCPGQDMRYWSADDAHEQKCPQCGEMVEFFKTDIRLRCPGCRARIANNSFDMGCAQWCAYAEQCLGPGARGLKQKPWRELIEDELEKHAGDLKEFNGAIKEKIREAESLCMEKEVDMLPVLIVLAATGLQGAGRIKSADDFIEKLSRDHNLPQQAIKDSKNIIERLQCASNENAEQEIVNRLLDSI